MKTLIDMPIFNKLALLFIAISLTGCSSIKGDFYDNVGLATPYLRSASSTFTGIVLSKAVSDSDRKAKAALVFKIAAVIEEMTVEDDLSVESLTEKISAVLPNKLHWDEYVVSIVLLYAEFHAQVQEGDETSKRKILVNALNRIADGCKASALSYQ